MSEPLVDEAGFREVPVSWESLEDAFENNAPDVHSYMCIADGDVRRIVDGVADPVMHRRIASDPNYLCVEPVSSREQYRWMERFIVTLEGEDARQRLTQAIDGKGAFRRFKDALVSYPEDRERWFAFRSDRLRVAMESWLLAHRIKPVSREEVARATSASEPLGPADGVGEQSDGLEGLTSILRTLSPREVDMVSTFVEFLQHRRTGRRPARAVVREAKEESGEARVEAAAK